MNEYPTYEFPGSEAQYLQSPSAPMSIPMRPSTSTRSVSSHGGSYTSHRGTPSSYSSLHNQRHHPYSASPSSRPSFRHANSGTSTASASERSGTEDEDDPYSSTGLEGESPKSSGSAGESALAMAGLHFGTSPSPKRKASSNKARTSHARKTAPGHVKRPPNAFIMFRSHCCNPGASEEDANAPGTPTAKQLADLNITDHRHISRIVSILWKQLSREEKAYWESRAHEKNEEHRRLYPDYKYAPQYRSAESIRRRKVHEHDALAEKTACEDVAYALLEHKAAVEAESGKPPIPYVAAREFVDEDEEEPRGVNSRVVNPPPSKWTPATYTAALQAGQVVPIPPPPKKGKSTRAKAKAKEKAKAKAHAGGSDGVATPTAITFASYEPPTGLLAPATIHRPRSAPSGGFQSTSSDRRDVAPHYVPDENLFHYAPESLQSSAVFHDPNLSYSPPQPQRHHYSPQQPPYNPPFAQYQPPNPVSQQVTFSPSYAPVRDAPPIQSPRTFEMQSYTLSGASTATSTQAPPRELALSPTSTSFAYRDAHDSVVPHNFPDRPVPNLTLAGMKRRGTLGRTTKGGDLMLISPTSDSFGRKFSLGRWELGPGETGQMVTRGGNEDDQFMTAFEFDQSFFDSVLRQNEPTTATHSFDPSYSPSVPRRPDTASSEASIDDQLQREQGGPAQSWNRTSGTSKGERGSYHVGGTDMFSHPEPALATPRQSISGHLGGAPPSFSFGTSFPSYPNFDPFSHRPSIDGVLSSSNEPHSFSATQWMSNIRQRGSDATIRFDKNNVGRPSTLGQAHDEEEEQEMEELESVDKSEWTERYVYLSREHAADPVLVDQILHAGFGVTYDYNGEGTQQSQTQQIEPVPSGFAVPYDHRPSTAPASC